MSDESKRELVEKRRMELHLEKRKSELRALLPHLPPDPGDAFGVKFYPWQRRFYDSPASMNLLCAANQIGKSTIGIRRHIANATDRNRWKRLFKVREPRLFWYFYPDSETLEREWETKWIVDWMPRGRMEKDPQYGWKLIRDRGTPTKIEWNSGVITNFLYYSKNRSNIQAATVDELYCDEELPVDFYDELLLRLTNTEGAFNMMFTPTLNQEFWKIAMEKKTVLPEALKLTVSMYDCLRYEDGSYSKWTLDKIKSIESKCRSQTEVNRRVHGRFVTESGRTYHAFDADKNMAPRRSFRECHIYACVDGGSGNTEGENKSNAHPAGIVFVAVRPDYKKGYVVKAWRGDGVKTTAGDVMDKYLELEKELGMPITQKWFDPSYVDFGIISNRLGKGFVKANKARERGEEVLNTLFKYQMLDLFDDDGEIAKLSSELSTLMKSNSNNAKNKKGDDLCDALRYNVVDIPWDFDAVMVAHSYRESSINEAKKPMTEEDEVALQIRMRRGEDVYGENEQGEGWRDFEADIEEWNASYEP